MTNKVIWIGTVESGWVDYNGHMNDAAYAQVFSLSLDALMKQIGLDAAGREKEAYTIFTLEAHLKYLSEAHKDEQLSVEVTVLDVDAKRMHLWFTMTNDAGDPVATSEQMVMGMSTENGRPAPFPKNVETAINELPNLEKTHWPETANWPMGIRRKG